MLISVAHTHRDKIDVADLEINIKEYPTYEADTHTQLTVLAQNSDCWKVSTGLKSVNRSSLNFNMRANLEGRCCLAIEVFLVAFGVLFPLLQKTMLFQYCAIN